MILPIRLWPDPILAQVCPPVETFGIAVTELAEDMLETMYAAPGRGLAAPQVGRLARIFVMDVAWKDGPRDPLVCVNPVITAQSSDVHTGQEGCLSIPDLPLQISRPAAISLTWQDVTGQTHTADLEGIAAICAQHELDHLDGRVIFDRIAPDLRAEREAAFLA